MEPQIIDQDEYTVTLKLPGGEHIKIAKPALPDLLAQLEFAVIRQGGTQ